MSNCSYNDLFISDVLLADPNLNITAKVLLQIIRRDVRAGRTIDSITKKELAQKINVSERTVQRCKKELTRKRYLPVVSADNETKGIVLSDELLADKTISLESKVIFKIVEQDIGSAKRFTTITNETIAERLAVSFGTISAKLKELSNERRIGIALENKVIKRKANSTPLNNQHPTGFRYIYLDWRLAVYRQRKITERKNKYDPDFWFNLSWAKEARKQKEADDAEWLEKKKREYYGTCTDEEIVELEKSAGIKAGTYLKYKREYLQEQERMRDYEVDDKDLFGD